MFGLIFTKTTFYFLIFIFFILFFNFINSGCLVYPATFTCSENLYWSFPKETVNDVNEWYELWSKAGATPNYVVEDRKFYIANFNWFGNWIDNYFFNKVSDFLLGLTFLGLIFWFYFFHNFKFIVKLANDLYYFLFNLHSNKFFFIMTITRLERKGLRNVSRAKRKKQIIKSLSRIPVIKNVDIEAVKKEFDSKLKTKSSNKEKKESPKKTEKKPTAKK